MAGEAPAGPSFSIKKVGAPQAVAAAGPENDGVLQPISDKLFYKEMAKIKENSK